MANGIYKDRNGDTVKVTNTTDGHYLLQYTDGRVVVI